MPLRTVLFAVIALTFAAAAPARADVWVAPGGSQPADFPISTPQGTKVFGQEDVAIQALKAAVAARPNDVNGYYRLGLAYQHLRRWEQAADICAKGVRLDSKNPDLPSIWGHALLRLNRYPEAIWVLEGLIRLDSGRPLHEVYFDLAQACYAMKWTDRAIDYATRHVQTGETAKGHALLARAYLLKGNSRMVAAELQRAIAAGDDNYDQSH